MDKETKELWQEMANHTLMKCKETCRHLGSCCSKEYCEIAIKNMMDAGESVPSPVVQNGRCVIPPHFRLICSLHQCKIAGLGCDPKDLPWTEKYFDLREKLTEKSILDFN